MYSVRLTRIPEDGVLKEDDLRLDLGVLGLGPPFESEGVSLSWELSRTMGKVYGNVHATAGMRLPCRRCLEEFSTRAHSDFAVLFEPRPHVSAGRGGGKSAPNEAAFDDEDEADAGPSVVLFDGEELPLGEEVRQELELAVPFNPLCREDCRGLCAQCGAHLNLGPCACKAPRG